MITANKGEWSELYVLFKLLGEKKIHAGDGQLNKLGIYYPIISILRDELKRHLEYSINKEIVIINEDGNEITRINTSDFLYQSQKLFSHIQRDSKGKGAFEIPSVNDFLQKIHCKKIKAKSQDKSDIHIILHDYHTGMQHNLGFSIKSEAGASASLLNASKPTTFVFEVTGKNISEHIANEINAISGKRKIQDRINAIYNHGLSLNFTCVPNTIFNSNLRMIDSQLPEILGWMMTDSYLNRDMNIEHATDRISRKNPFNYPTTIIQDFYGYKIKSLMVCTALGMRPATPWNGRYDATGGYIVVKGNGDVICFHIYDRNLLEDYLFHNTKFDTPTTSNRYEIGYIYKNNNKFYFNLILQIRFK